MEVNFLALLVAALSTLVVGFIWYNPKVFGTAWMNSAGLTEEKLKGANMAKIFGLSIVFAFLMAFILQFLVIHQWGVLGVTGGDPKKVGPVYDAFMAQYGTAYRTFKHGALHGFMTGLFFTFPLVAINAMFERKSWKFIFINSGYWIVNLTIMGGIICAWI
ncbi:DUF1761 domain-containing protein [Flavobacterium microcysteis]|jgi:hypothetical protein|uniref:DUF1761 domain-containing protein n=1 Tax=Flavobacterium microcysteis TaxID=2596891 RepID=A0A501PYQ7_9FLAO|nr:DUF1761 domain-containing protein [Flavobacterium microcysteis]TPD65689.1 DUF1761 domain-containing protein [Flavobacterium microcysteis]